VFGSLFGGVGVGDGEFSGPVGVAVDEATGLVYVSDTGNNRVEVFRRGLGGAYEFVSAFVVRDPGPIAVDNSSNASDSSQGEVYVAGAGTREEAEEGERDTLFVYSPALGEVTRKVHVFRFKVKGGEELEEEFTEGISGVAVDGSGVLWVYWEEEGVVDGFVKGVAGNGKTRLEWRPGLRRSMEERFGCYARPAFAVAPDASAFYVGYERRDENEECPGERGEGGAPDPVVVAKLDDASPVSGVVIAEMDRRDTTGAATDPSDGDVYLDDVSSVVAYTSAGVLIQRFGEGDIGSGSGMAVDAATGEVFVADRSQDRVVVFGPEEATGAPVVDGVSSTNVTPSSARLRAQIDPRGLETEYRFEYGTRDCREAGSGCTSLPVGKLPAGFGDVSVTGDVSGLKPATGYFYRVLASDVAGVNGGVGGTFGTLPSPGVLLDGRGWELVSPVDKHGSTVETVSSLRSGSIQASVDGSRLVWLAAGPVVSEPEGNRAFELSQLMSVRTPGGWVTSSLETPHTNGWGLLLPSPGEYHFFTSDLSAGLVEPTEWEKAKTEGVVEHPALSPAATEKTMYVRPDLPNEHPAYTPLVTAANDTAGTRFGGGLGFVGATSDLSHVVFSSQVGLTAEHPSSGGLYMWQESKPLRLVSVLPDGSPAADDELVEPALGAAEDLDTRNAISDTGEWVVWSDGAGLYIRNTVSERTIRINAAQGHEAIESGPGGEVVAEPPEEQDEREVRFQSASADGKRVFFTDTARLTEGSNQTPVGSESPADLYEFELTGESLMRGRLYDLTTGASDASADVLSVIPGSSENGASVYFVANGVLAPGAVPGRCARDLEESEPSPPGATCNLYVSEEAPGQPGEREVRFIAALSSEDGADWSASPTSALLGAQRDLSELTARVSPNGRYLAFMSEQPLTGYDNRDQSSGESDEEVYLYDATTSRLTCVSCNANPAGEGGGWQQPLGVFDREFAGEGIGLLVDRPEVWHGRWLAGSIPSWDFNRDYSNNPAALYQPRYLSDSGRMFFDSADALTSQDSNGKEDVYEYEPGGTGSCESSGGCVGLISSGASDRESVFLDASENGDDVFFATATPLVAADTDPSLDIYDAHVCTTASPCLQYPSGSSEQCETANECRPGTVSPPSVNVPATARYTGPGNPPAKTTTPAQQKVAGTKTTGKPRTLTRTQKLTKALQACRIRYKHNKHKRHACEAQAREHYGPIKHKTAKKAQAHKASSTSSGRGG
jgi:DNA-binding beta-propeller fold protein YncE